MLERRLEAFERWQTMQGRTGRMSIIPKSIIRICVITRLPKAWKTAQSLDEVDPELLRTYEKLGIPLQEQEVLAGARKSPSMPCLTACRLAPPSAKSWQKRGIFCSFSEAVKDPDLVRKYLGSVVPQSDNGFAALNSAVFSDGSFVYIPPGVRCPMELSTFRINEAILAEFERTLVIADRDSYVSYLEGCTAPMRDENQLHAAVVELVRWRMRRLNIRPYRTGTRVMPTARAAFIIS